MSRLYTTSQGAERLEQSSELQQVVERFMDPEIPTEKTVGEAPLIGKGSFARIYAVGNVAIKISAPSTVEIKGKIPEDLTTQFRFMSALSTYLKDQGSDVTTPDYYFAAKNGFGDNLLGCQLMDDWQTVHQWLNRHNQINGMDKLNGVSKVIKRRITEAVASPILRVGLNDLSSLSMRGAHNVLVPSSIENPSDGPLCVIDQPKRSIIGYASAIAIPAVGIMDSTKPLRESSGIIGQRYEV